MKDTECNKFLTLLMGECWHEWDIAEYCKLCRESRHTHKNPNHLSNPLPVIKWMEKKMPEVLEGYAEDLWFKRLWDTNMQMIMAFLDLRNLVSWLSEHQEWGEMECKDCEGTGEKWNCNDAWACPTCNGSGLIVHPALQYARDNKEEG